MPEQMILGHGGKAALARLGVSHPEELRERIPELSMHPHSVLHPPLAADSSVSLLVHPEAGRPIVVEFAGSATHCGHRFIAHEAIGNALRQEGLPHRVVRPLAASRIWGGVFVAKAAPETYVNGRDAAIAGSDLKRLETELERIRGAVQRHAPNFLRDLDFGGEHFSNVFIHPRFPAVNRIVLVDQGHAPRK